MTNTRQRTEATPAGSAPLRLRARDADDLQTISAFLQDALVPLSEVAYLNAERRFVLVANRFRWESAPAVAAPPPEGDVRFAASDGTDDGEARFERVNCGVCFDRVRTVRFKGLDARRKSQILDLLTIQSRPEAITLVFAGDAAIRLEVDGILCHLEDLGEPWPTSWRPTHTASDADRPEQR